jgi:hypothetical protein
MHAPVSCPVPAGVPRTRAAHIRTGFEDSGCISTSGPEPGDLQELATLDDSEALK